MEKRCKVWNAFLEDYNDDELQFRYDKFVENFKRCKKDYNDLIPIINNKIEEYHNIEKIILQSALLKIINTEMILKRLEIQKEIDELKDSMGKLQESFTRDEELAKSYELAAENRLFVWYKSLKSVSHPEVKNYIDFKKKWGNRII